MLLEKQVRTMIKTIPTNRPGRILRSDRRRWTYDHLREMPETMDRYEIIDGVLHMSPSAHVRRHQEAVGNLYFMLAGWVRDHDLGKVYTAPADVVAAPGRVVQPDLFFVVKDRLHIVDAYVDGVPDLVMEVISPSSIDYDRTTKFDLYEDIGVREYWLVDPEQQSVEVFVLHEARYEPLGYFAVGEQARSALLEGFAVAVDSIFS